MKKYLYFLLHKVFICKKYCHQSWIKSPCDYCPCKQKPN